jgi:Zn-dependent protease with chaperone function
MLGILPVIFALVIAECSVIGPRQQAALPGWLLLVAAVGGVVVWLVVGEVAARLVVRRGTHRALVRWEFTAQVVIMLWFAWLCYGWGWSRLSGSSMCVALAPWLAMQCAHWWSMTPAIRAASGHPWTRWGRVAHQFNFGLLPIALILPVFDIGAWIANTWRFDGWFGGFWGGLAGVYLGQLTLLGMLIVLPAVLVRVWGAKPMVDGERAGLLRRACATMRVPIAGLLRWPVPGGRVYNAAVIGMVPRLRYVLFTEDLLRDLPEREVLAVLGHELGHARHGHLWIYFLFANVALLMSMSMRQDLAEVIQPALSDLFAAVPGLGRALPVAGVSEGLALLLVMAVLWRLVFGVLSRACERQADLAGAELAGDVTTMREALKSVARLSGQPENEPSWRHYSIAERVAFLDAVSREPALATQHHDRVRRMRNSLLALILFTFALLVLREYWMPSPASRHHVSAQQAAAALATWTDRDKDLAEALAEADQGRLARLKRWVSQASDTERQVFVECTMKLGFYAGPKDADGDPQNDDRMFYRYRFRLVPFLAQSTGSTDLDLGVENAFAYVAVAGTTTPTPSDLALVRDLLPALEQANKDQPQHSVYDTVCCIQFVLGDYAKAADSERRAEALLAEEQLDTSDGSGDSARVALKKRTQTAELYRRRREAAAANAALAPGKTPQPLPYDWPGAPGNVPAPLPGPPVKGAPAAPQVTPAPQRSTAPAAAGQPVTESAQDPRGGTEVKVEKVSPGSGDPVDGPQPGRDAVLPPQGDSQQIVGPSSTSSSSGKAP